VGARCAGGVIRGTQSTDLRSQHDSAVIIGEFGGDRNLLAAGNSPDPDVRAISIFGGVGAAAAIGQEAPALLLNSGTEGT
jgi:hypothetical protein